MVIRNLLLLGSSFLRDSSINKGQFGDSLVILTEHRSTGCRRTIQWSCLHTLGLSDYNQNIVCFRSTKRVRAKFWDFYHLVSFALPPYRIVAEHFALYGDSLPFLCLFFSVFCFVSASFQVGSSDGDVLFVSSFRWNDFYVENWMTTVILNKGVLQELIYSGQLHHRNSVARGFCVQCSILKVLFCSSNAVRDFCSLLVIRTKHFSVFVGLWLMTVSRCFCLHSLCNCSATPISSDHHSNNIRTEIQHTKNTTHRTSSDVWQIRMKISTKITENEGMPNAIDEFRSIGLRQFDWSNWERNHFRPNEIFIKNKSRNLLRHNFIWSTARSVWRRRAN